ncbi:MAG: hypothetical protein LH603_18040 [Pseudonocardia sp.]|nr:hypothetical protein [Pseudonocardia sp.]
MSADVVRLTSPAFSVGTPGDADDGVLVTFEGAAETAFIRLTGPEAAGLGEELVGYGVAGR